MTSIWLVVNLTTTVEDTNSSFRANIYLITFGRKGAIALKFFNITLSLVNIPSLNDNMLRERGVMDSWHYLAPPQKNENIAA